MNIDQAVARACEEPTLLEALSWICVWENDRSVRQAVANNGAGWDTCFTLCIKRVMESYPKSSPEDQA
jgi:hypothetical protein